MTNSHGQQRQSMLKRESRNTTNIMKRTKWKRYVYVRDVQGNIRAVVGENNAVAEQTDYYPYGMPMADVNSVSAQPFKFGGKELEREGGTDFYDFEARRLDFALGRFTSPDPLCEQTPEISPYAYCAADPVNFIDPTGEDTWQLNENGIVIKRIATTEYDAFQIVNGSGEIANSIQFDYGTINASTEISKDGTSYDVYRLNENGTALFEFLSENTSVEWSNVKLENADKKELDMVISSHEHSQESGVVDVLNYHIPDAHKIKSVTHSHPDNTSYPSGLGKNEKDIKFAAETLSKFKQPIVFYIYTPLTGLYFKYNPESKITEFPTNNLPGVTCTHKR